MQLDFTDLMTNIIFTIEHVAFFSRHAIQSTQEVYSCKIVVFPYNDDAIGMAK